MVEPIFKLLPHGHVAVHIHVRPDSVNDGQLCHMAKQQPLEAQYQHSLLLHIVITGKNDL